MRGTIMPGQEDTPSQEVTAQSVQSTPAPDSKKSATPEPTPMPTPMPMPTPDLANADKDEDEDEDKAAAAGNQNEAEKGFFYEDPEKADDDLQKAIKTLKNVLAETSAQSGDFLKNAMSPMKSTAKSPGEDASKSSNLGSLDKMPGKEGGKGGPGKGPDIDPETIEQVAVLL